MKVYEASRLSDGNKIFPSKITVDESGITLKIPGFFSGKEKTLTFFEISSVSVETPMIGFSKIDFKTTGFDRIYATGFSKDDALEIKKLVQEGITLARSGVILGGSGMSSNGSVNLNISSPSNAEAEAKKAEIERAASKELEMREKVNYITQIKFSAETDELMNQLNEIASIGASASQYDQVRPIKKSVYEKMELGVFKLRQMGLNSEADFFEKKRQGIKPKWYETF
jgi:hypothetical protein